MRVQESILAKQTVCPFMEIFWTCQPYAANFFLVLQKGMVNWNARNLLNFVEGKRQLRRRLETHIVPEGVVFAHASFICPTNVTGSTNWKRAFCMALLGKSTRLMGCSFCVAVTMTCVTGSVANKSRAIRSDKPHK